MYRYDYNLVEKSAEFTSSYLVETWLDYASNYTFYWLIFRFTSILPAYTDWSSILGDFITIIREKQCVVLLHFNTEVCDNLGLSYDPLHLFGLINKICI